MVMSVSTYSYLTGAALELFLGLDLSTIDATIFHDDNIGSLITGAEERVNAHLGVSAAQTVTNAISICTKLYCRLHVEQVLNAIGWNETQILTMTEKEVIALSKELLAANDPVGVDSIPMSGATRF